jgi:hypothetical protein
VSFFVLRIRPTTNSATRVAWRIRTRRGDEGGVDREASAQTTIGAMSRLSEMSIARVYPLYVQKLERKGRTRAELDDVIEWLTGLDRDEVQRHLDSGSSFEQFFAASTLNPNASAITGVICGVRVEEMSDPLDQKVRYLDKLVDELAKGKAMEKVLRS